MLAFIQEQIVTQMGWLTPQEFVDGLALGQLSPGPILMLAAFIGFKLKGIVDGTIAAGATRAQSSCRRRPGQATLSPASEAAWMDFTRRIEGLLSPDEPHKITGGIPRLDSAEYRGRISRDRTGKSPN